MGHDKLRKFAENETFTCLLQPSSSELLADGFANLRDHPVKGHWGEFFNSLGGDNTGISRPIILELGCGKGEYSVDMALRNPGINYIGVDIKGARLWTGARFASEHHIPNLAFLRTKVEFLGAFFGPGEVSEIWLTFSDPQFRSANSRLSSPPFLERYRNILVPGGIVHLKTDSRFLYQYTLSVCAVNGLKVLACADDLYGAEHDKAIPPEVYEVRTFYEKMFLGQGYKIHYLSFVIDREGAYSAPRDPEDFDSDHWRSIEGPRLLFGHDSAETKRQKHG